MNENNKNIFKNKEFKNRLNKLKLLKKKKILFPNNFKRNNISYILHKKYDKYNKEYIKKLNLKIKISGRMINCRHMGKSSFIQLQDMFSNIQVYISKKYISNNNFKNFKKWDLGDILGVVGTLFKTNSGELSIYCNKIYLLTKSLRPLPEKFHGLNNTEIKYRQRYLDLIKNKKTIKIFKIRHKIIFEIRKYMISHNFIEVETPIMQLIPGGASAKPFITYHNSLNQKMYLRISPELYLKRLVIGGLERVFEIGKNFRNEGLSSKHNPEFTMLELYIAYFNYKDLIKFTKNFLYILFKKIIKDNKIIINDNIIYFNNFNEMTMKESIIKYNNNINLKDLSDLNTLNFITNKLNIKKKNQCSKGYLIYNIFKKTVENKLIQPTFITEYPIEISPLSRSINKNKNFAERFELFINGQEIGNGFSELNDSQEQKKRFNNQLKLDKYNVNNKCLYDKDYIIALEHGLPPTSGLGIGIDRLIMLFTNKCTIKDVILFPTLKII
ncbi:Lysine--tRNA ligase, heat inducible [Candidatus Annandia adelgestsuga]|uniref:Lysine--tRNA ligase n=1 Tax=Candidatus Annandia adelgestsuga TaxID=1302411 RepID=A0A3S5HNX0_9ENTR|nr:lysine--tRNA ligase [Candidatus Annandia adelgestsuga]AZP36274.1 Lysine--tRNA ligase, heat inducible [Candidatus Annandia adelgestsuga]